MTFMNELLGEWEGQHDLLILFYDGGIPEFFEPRGPKEYQTKKIKHVQYIIDRENYIKHN